MPDALLSFVARTAEPTSLLTTWPALIATESRRTADSRTFRHACLPLAPVTVPLTPGSLYYTEFAAKLIANLGLLKVQSVNCNKGVS